MDKREERAEKTEALHAELVERIAQLQTSEDWKNALDFYARFHKYSMGNAMLIDLQSNFRGFQASRVAGFNAWKKLGRSVRKGERGLAIFAPMVRKFEVEQADGTSETVRALRGFRIAYVFDVSQTAGAELPADVMTPRLLSDADGNGGAYAELEKFAGTLGVSVSLGHAHGANGFYNPAERSITVEVERTRAQQEKTLAHECAHAILHSDLEAFQCRGEIEVEAEAVAYVVMRALGRDCAGYSLPYIIGWGRSAPDAVKKSMGRITSAAKKILAALEVDAEEVDAA